MRTLLSLAFAAMLGSLGCMSTPVTSPAARRDPPVLQEPAWFGATEAPTSHDLVDFAWAVPGLDLRGQAVELAPWEVPATPPSGTEARPWAGRRDQVTGLLQTLTAEGMALAQQMNIPPGSTPAYRVQGRLLAFDRQARVAAKAGQILGNVVLVPVNLAMLLVARGGPPPPLFITGVSGYRTEALFQVKVVDLKKQQTVLGLQSWVDFKSLETPTRLVAALWNLSGGAMAAKDWWPTRDLHEEDGDLVWFQPGLDLSRSSIRCLRWLPGPSLDGPIPEKDLNRSLQANLLPGMLIDPDEKWDGPVLSEYEGSLFLQGICPGPRNSHTCQVKLWNPATGQVLGLMQVTKGFWRSNIEKDWVRRIKRHLRARRGADPGASAGQT